MVAQLLKKFPRLDLASALCSKSEYMQSTTTYFFSINFQIILTDELRSSKWYPNSRVVKDYIYYFSSL
jgi:hypothetical protein